MMKKKNPLHGEILTDLFTQGLFFLNELFFPACTGRRILVSFVEFRSHP